MGMNQPSYAVLELSILGSGMDQRVLEIGVVLLDSQGKIERRWAMSVAYTEDEAPAVAPSLRPTFRDIARHMTILLRGRILVANNIDMVCHILRDEYNRIGVQLPQERFGFSLREYGYEGLRDAIVDDVGDYLDAGGVYSSTVNEYAVVSGVLRAAETIANTLQELMPYVVADLERVAPLQFEEFELRGRQHWGSIVSVQETVPPSDGGSPLTRGDFAELFPWFSGVNNDIEAVIGQWIAEFSMLPLYKISPVLNPSALPDGFDKNVHYVQRWLAHFPKPLYATMDDVLGGQGLGKTRAEAFIRTLVLYAIYVGFARHHPGENPPLLPSADLIAGWLDLHGTWPDYKAVVHSRNCFPEAFVEALVQNPSPAGQVLDRAVSEVVRVVEQDPFRFTAIISGRASKSKTVEAVGADLAITRDRARQLELRIGERLRKQGKFCELLASAMITRFYPCARVETILREMPMLGEAFDARMECTMFEVLCWAYSRQGVPNSRRAATRWEVQNGWLVCHEFKPLLANLLKTLGDSFGIVKTATLLAQLERRSGAHFVDEFLAFTLEEFRYKERGPVLVPIEQSIAQMAGVELTLCGHPMTTNQLCDRMLGRTQTSVVSALSNSDKFYRCAIDTWALRGWSYEEWTNLANLLTRRILKRGGEAPMDWLIEQATAFGVTKSSVVTYLRGPEFLIGEHKMVRINTTEPVCHQTPELAKAMYYRDGAWMQLVTVTQEHLRGSGTVVQQAVVNLYGLVFNRPIKIPSRLGPQAIRWGRSNCVLGTVRRFLDELGCTLGDRVFFVFGETFDVVRAPDQDLKLRGKRAVLNAMGLERQPNESPFETVNKALGLPADAVRTHAIERLIARGEKDLAEKLRWA